LNLDRKHKHDAEKILADVRNEQVFTCHNGDKLRNLKELGDALSNKDNAFSGDWNTDRKALGEWVRNAVRDVKLAYDLESATSRTHGAWEVANRLLYLTRWIW
jgi:hypothetical protein